ncbi:hypothetical protein EG850_12240 [Gulosibacter macacae]|uniref:Uncharacterized protein n=1 Tax=Gulosibacter macacae TaxID=2488791 RepID=A0A3P3VSF2_9MICO|nr:hypothetical protein [Gulosibacter macacae]RRJ85685.1 hypothetical protein EG850_12240 [Gulosibacter macacae]
MEQTSDGTELPDVQAARPSSADILREIEELRGRDGISPAKIRAVAPRIQTLPVVEDHRRFKGFAARDQHLAAYGAIGCVLNHAIAETTWRYILILTLRYDYELLPNVKPAAGWHEVRRASSLGARHDLVMALLNYEKSRYHELVRLAYDELVGQLLLRDTSPCRGATAQAIEELAIELALDELLVRFSIEIDQVRRERIAARALKQVDARWQPSGSTAREQLISVVGQTIASEYPDAVRSYIRSRQVEDEAQFGRHDVPPHGYVIAGVDLEYLIGGDPGRPFLDRVESLSLIGYVSTVSETTGETRTGERFYHSEQIVRSFRLLTALLEAPASLRAEATSGRDDAKDVRVVDDDLDLPPWLRIDPDE